MDAHVVAVDIGSVREPSNFAWAAFDHSALDPVETGRDPGACVEALADRLKSGAPTVLLLEAPMAVPIPSAESGWRGLGSARTGEGNRAWSAGAGAGVLATGLAQGSWILGELAAAVSGLTVTTQTSTWRDGHAQLLLAEAFVSGSGKQVAVSAESSHLADAIAAGKELVQRLVLGQFDSDVKCVPARTFNLLAAMATWASLPVDPAELHLDVLVVKLMPVPKA